MNSKQIKIYIPRDEMLLTWDPENMDKYWSQCKLYDSHPLTEQVYKDGVAANNQSEQLFYRFTS